MELKKIITFLMFLFYFGNLNADLIQPNEKLDPYDVVKIQLVALKNNNKKDEGIRQTWVFAHPDNKKITGPLEKFTQMIYSENYKILISHINSEIKILSENNNKNVYKVFILSKDKKKYSYIWQIEKVKQEGSLMNCWMTTSVSSPEYLGEII